MSLGRRRPKAQRAQLRSPHPLDIQRERSARRRSRLARLAIVGAAVVAIAAIVHGSGPPFPYRLGQRPGRELRVSVPAFQVKNQRKTNAVVQEAADRSPRRWTTSRPASASWPSA